MSSKIEIDDNFYNEVYKAIKLHNKGKINEDIFHDALVKYLETDKFKHKSLSSTIGFILMIYKNKMIDESRAKTRHKTDSYPDSEDLDWVSIAPTLPEYADFEQALKDFETQVGFL